MNQETHPDDELVTVAVATQGTTYAIPLPPTPSEVNEDAIGHAMKKDMRFAALREAVELDIPKQGTVRSVSFDFGNPSGWWLHDMGRVEDAGSLFLGETRDQATIALERYVIDADIPVIYPTPSTYESTKHRRLVEWENVGVVVYELDPNTLTKSFLRLIINACRADSYLGMDDDYIEENNLLTAALQALTSIILRHDLCHGGALDYFLIGGYTALAGNQTILPPLIGDQGLQLIEVDTSEPTLDAIFVGHPYR